MNSLSTPAAPEKNQPKAASMLREYAVSLLWALGLAFVIRTCVIQTFEIPSSSMEDTLEVGDYLIANKYIYGVKLPMVEGRLPKLRDPERGDVVIFKYPGDRSLDYIKRVVGIPGDEVMVKGKRLYVNGRPADGPHAVHKDPAMIPASGGPRDEFGPVRVPAGHYFVMGDNRDHSYDSRFWGFVPEADIVGKAMVKYWSKEPGMLSIRWGSIGKIIE